MLTILMVKLDKIDLVTDPERIMYLALAEIVLFDAPLVLILIYMWQSVGGV